ncbi:MAG: DeoR/GlpR transcriptional regulator, partial [Planctomycetota bacterium]
MSATTEQRRDSILSQVYESGRVTIKDLAEGLGVSQATVRRDIRGLAQAGQVEIVHGGATLPR